MAFAGAPFCGRICLVFLASYGFFAWNLQSRLTQISGCSSMQLRSSKTSCMCCGELELCNSLRWFPLHPLYPASADHPVSIVALVALSFIKLASKILTSFSFSFWNSHLRWFLFRKLFLSLPLLAGKWCSSQQLFFTASVGAITHLNNLNLRLALMKSPLPCQWIQFLYPFIL